MKQYFVGQCYGYLLLASAAMLISCALGGMCASVLDARRRTVRRSAIFVDAAMSCACFSISFPSSLKPSNAGVMQGRRRSLRRWWRN